MSPKLLNLLLLLIPVSLYYGYIDPYYNGTPGLVWTPETSIFALRSQNVQYENASKQISFIESEAKKLQKDYDLVDKDLKDKVAIMLPESIDSIKLRNEVIAIANKVNIGVTNLSVVDLVKGPQSMVTGYKVSFSVNGHYDALKKLLEAYERNKRLFIINTVTINHKEKEDEKQNTDPSASDPDMLQMMVTFEVYSLK